ncbi:signal transducer and activator of transcription 2 isoform X1 [Pelobates cultripes]|uniref:Signal transducer and activator of transcription n=1 Tax=Pelobates cultripes TaxID=61616 RepID=A0AAD1R6M7_PELCU|nr:signal transducer and activator of transcription 2 isoform X1 [Pelobates cultripes]
MSQWAALLGMTNIYQEQVLGLYSHELLPMEVRQYLAPWIESQDWKQAARDRSLADIMFQNLLENLDTQYSRFTQEQEILQSLNIRKLKLEMQALYQAEPQKLAELIRDLLYHEKTILSEFQDMQSQAEKPVQVPMEVGQNFEIELRVSKVKEHAQLLDHAVKFLEDQQETFDFKYKTFQLLEANRSHGEQYLKPKRTELQQQLNELDRKRKEVLDQMKELLGLCETLLKFLEKELEEWLMRLKLSCIGAPLNTCLEQLEKWVTKLVEVFFQMRLLLKLLNELHLRLTYEGDPLKTDPPILEERLLELLCCLLKKAFVVDKQPIMAYPCRRPLVLKTGPSSFSVRARLLVNLPELRHNMKVSYVMDKNPPDIKGYRKFNVLGTPPKAMEDCQGEGLMVEYKHLTLKEQKSGPGGKGSKGASDASLSVVEELHVITFTTLFDYQDLKLNLEAVTLPFVVITNVSQFVGAWASVFWFNLLSPDPKDLTFFSKPPPAPWVLLANALSWQFLFSTKRGLNQDQLQMLGKKLCGTELREDSQVSWSRFSKENLSRVSFTFWTWFDAILALVKSHLEGIWNDGHVMGFVSRSKEENLLKTKMDGTFLLRFSESVREGGITFSWVEHQVNGSYIIRSVEPYTKRELLHIPLTEILRNYQLMAEENIPENPLKYLYPNIPKDQAFGQYYEHRSEITSEYEKYLRRKLIIVSKRQDDDTLSSFDPATPQPNDTSAIMDELDLTRCMMNDSDPMMPSLPLEILEELNVI